MKLSPNFGFRVDINAYRAFSVIAVFLNHLFPFYFPNGYLGVDLFFIISGYVICLSLEKRVQSNLKNLTKGFFYRRIVRIAPPLLAFVLITYSLSLLIIPPASSLSLLSQRSALSSLFGLSNLYFYKQSLNYFGPLADLNPFTHTWSLGVEEQFYLFFPILFLFIRSRSGGQRKFILAACILLIISLTLFISLYYSNQPAAYFLPQSRAFQFFIGILLFYLTSLTILSNRLSQPLSEFLFLSIIIVLFTPLALPSLFSHLLVSLTFAMLLLRRAPSPRLSKLFTNPVISFLGASSYSLYLWHWPIIVFSKYLAGSILSNPLVITTLTLFTSTLSYLLLERYVPRILSNISRQSLVFYLYPISALFISLIVFLIHPFRHNLFLTLYLKPSEDKKLASTCHHNTPFSIVGDSHAFSAIQQSCSDLMIISSSFPGTPFPATLYSNSIAGLSFTDSNASKDLSESSIYPKLRSSPPHDVFLINRLDYYFSNPIGSFQHDRITHFTKSGTSISQHIAFNLWLRDLTHLVKEYPRHNFIVVLPVPSFGKLYPQSLCTITTLRPNPDQHCSDKILYNLQYNRIYSLKKRLLELEQAIPNLSIYDPTHIFCSPTHCSTHHLSKRVYLDDNHLNHLGASLLNKGLSIHRGNLRK